MALRSYDDRIAELEAEIERLKGTLRRVQRIGMIGSVEVDLRNNAFRNFRSPEYLVIHGLPANAANETHEAWVARIHPEDRQKTENHFLTAVAGAVTDYTAEYRIIRPSDGETRWIFVKGVIERGLDGKPLRFAGAHLDVTDRRLLEQQSEMVAREFAHRIKNLGSVVRALVSMSARSKPEAGPFAEALRGRIDALFRAKELVRPSRHDQFVSHTLLEIVGILLAPYAGEDGAVQISGYDARIGPNASMALALAIHELATNAAKYGALSADKGTVSIALRRDGDEIHILWVEQGGPPVPGKPTHSGFGSDMLERSLALQLQATISREWLREGVRVVIQIPAENLSR
jgi:PAS domain S-box-containing protein